ncbi:carbohydrate kinase family protein [Pseudogemmobacter faecipullorum]|uniref:Carbohydrate kinase n=1 Tax=Pseudogemmobacter faecipullorum TaxID=2755041 RepID=A0ABS8CLH4_9RHOB|nr:carbohydrate kinase [Pseudogemmobacter faecipullorum]MCB5410219.1 carbohydrate kinase [Pseudogemmobacter faecipullorum]
MILCCGEALIDMLPRLSTEGEAAFAPKAGGAVFNTAIALGRLGEEVSFFSGVSTDMLGEILVGTLSASQVDTALLARSNRPTTVAFVKLVNGQASYAFYDEASAGRLLSAADLPALTEKTRALFFGGISLVNDPAASAYEALLNREADSRLIMLDPNIRPGFLVGKEADYRARIDRMIAKADIVKLSDEDLHWLEGEGRIADLAQGILARGPELVLITEGAKGATAFSARGGARQRPAPVVSVADTVGAGDTFNAGFLAGLSRAGKADKAGLSQLSPEELDACLDLGIRAAAITVSRAGANPPWKHEI